MISVETLFRGLQVTLRLSLLNPPSAQLIDLVSIALARLETIEQTLPDEDVIKPVAHQAALPPHSGQDLFKNAVSDEENVVWWYGQCVETLWRITMSLPEASAQWADLTHKLLVWRAHAGAENSAVGEWARKEVVKSFA